MTEAVAIAAALAALASLLIVVLRFRTHARRADSDIQSWKDRVARGLSEARDERNRLLDSLDDALFLVDANGIIRFTNAAARQLLGSSVAVGKPWAEALPDPRLGSVVRDSIDSGKPLKDSVVLPQQTSPRGDREDRGINAWVIDASPIATGNDGPAFTRIILRDMTSEHQIDQIRKDFVANASHELRTPMAIINGYLENLLDDNMVENPEVSRRFLGVMRKHAERISRIVEDMLVISRLESGEANALKVEPFHLRSCLNDVIERLESVIHSRQAVVRLDLPEHPPVILHGDRFYWTQVFFNLVENALKQNPHPGLEIVAGCRPRNGGIQIWISDNGIGIPSADLPYIFRRFYRVEKHHSQQEIKGTGLGLSIVKRAIEAHGGTISVTSTPGQETRFVIDLPASAVAVVGPELSA